MNLELESLKTSEKYITYFQPKNKKNEPIYFTENRLKTLYYLLSFNYISREMIDKIHFSISGKKMPINWLQSLIGNRNLPLTEHKYFKDGRKKIYYFNKDFSLWIQSKITLFYPDLLPYFSTDQKIEEELYYFFSDKKMGIKKLSANQHDLSTRKVVCDVLSMILKDEKDFNVQVIFPYQLNSSYIVPDAVLFINGSPHYIEFDNLTETQTRLLGKVNTYASLAAFWCQNFYFVFRTMQNENKNVVAPRVRNFVENIENSNVLNVLHKRKMNLYAYPLSSASLAIYKAISGNNRPPILEILKQEIKNEVESNLEIFLDLQQVETHAPFDYYLEILNDRYENKSVPTLFLDYGLIGNQKLLDELWKSSQNDYERIAIIEDMDMKGDKFIYNLPCYSHYFVRTQRSDL